VVPEDLLGKHKGPDMKKIMNLLVVMIVGLFVGGGALIDQSLNCSGDKHGDADKKQTDGH
jgi:hypothetical protein